MFAIMSLLWVGTSRQEFRVHLFAELERKCQDYSHRSVDLPEADLPLISKSTIAPLGPHTTIWALLRFCAKISFHVRC